jgi:hypothetical protein
MSDDIGAASTNGDHRAMERQGDQIDPPAAQDRIAITEEKRDAACASDREDVASNTN